MKTRLSNLKNFILKEKYFFILFVIGLAIFSLWLIAFYPGLMTPDSIDHWAQAKSFGFNNHHPYLYSLIIGILQRIIYSPAFIAIIQIIIAAGIPAFFINLLLKKGYKKIPLIVLFLIYTLLPCVGLFNITLWKDIAYTNMIFLCIVLVSRNILNGIKSEDWKFNKKNAINLIFATILFSITSYFRHNGIIFLVALPFIYFLLNIYTLKKALILLGTCLIGYIFINSILAGILHVSKPNFINASVVIHLVAAAFDGGYVPNEYEKATIEKLVPIENLKERYSCITSNNIVFNNPEYNPNSIIEDPEYIDDFYRASISIIRKNIPQILANRVCMASNLFGLGRDRFYYGDFTIDPVFALENNIPQTANNPLTTLLTRYVKSSSNNVYLNLVFWNPLPYILIILLVSLYKRSRLVTGFMFLSLINLVPLALGGVGGDFRFVYSIVILGIFSLAFIFDGQSLKSGKEITNWLKKRWRS